MSIEKTLTATLEAFEKLRFGLRDLRPPLSPVPPNQVLLRIIHVGISASDAERWLRGPDGEPCVLGDEASAVVLEVGREAVRLEPGNRVVVGPSPESTLPHGMFAEHVVLHESVCHKLPENVDLRQAALMKPWAKAVNACERSQLSSATSLLVLGDNLLGLLCLAAARQLGASDVTLFDTNGSRRELAQQMGASRVVCGQDALQDALRDSSWDVVLETCGKDQSARQALQCAKDGGRVVLVDHGSPETEPRLAEEASKRNVVLVAAFCYDSSSSEAIRLLGSGSIDLQPLISHDFPLIEAKQALETAVSGGLKVMLTCAEEDDPLA